MKLKDAGSIKWLGNVFSITDATKAVKDANMQWPGLIRQEKYRPILPECSAILFVGRGTVKSEKNDKDPKNAMSILAVWETEYGNSYEIVRNIFFSHTAFNSTNNPTNLVHNMWKDGKMWLASDESGTKALYLFGLDSLIFRDLMIERRENSCGLFAERTLEIHRVANVSKNVWVFVTSYRVYRLESRGDRFFATEIWGHEDEKWLEHLWKCPEGELDVGLRAIACVTEDCFLVGGDKLRLFVLRKGPGGAYSMESIDGFGAMVWDIAQIRENVWLVGGDNGELRILTLKNDRFELGERIAGFRRERIRTIYVAPRDEVIVGGKGFCKVLRIED